MKTTSNTGPSLLSAAVLLLTTIIWGTQGLEDECISAAICHLIRGDIAREFNASTEEHYAAANFEISKLMKFKGCGVHKITQNCERRKDICKIHLRIQAKQRFVEKGIRAGIFDECPYGAWPYVLFLCKNTQHWPKSVTDLIPKHTMLCNTSCSVMNEFEEFHLLNRKTKADFPLMWEEKKTYFETIPKKFASFDSAKSNPFPPELKNIAKIEARQSGGSTPFPFNPDVKWKADDLVQRLTFGDEFAEGDSLGEIFCPRFSYINRIWEILPHAFYFNCGSSIGTEQDQISYQYPGPVDPSLEIPPSEAINSKDDLRPSRYIDCFVNKFKHYQPPIPHMLGVQMRLTSGSGGGTVLQFVSGRYLCAGDGIWTDWTTPTKPTDRFRISEQKQCPQLTAMCSIDIRRYVGSFITRISFGCCEVHPFFNDRAEIFHVAPYGDPVTTNVGNSSWPSFQDIITRTSRAYHFHRDAHLGVIRRETYKCGPGYYADGFRTKIFRPVDEVKCVRATIVGEKCEDPIPYIFRTELNCTTIGKQDTLELLPIRDFFARIPEEFSESVRYTYELGNEKCSGFYTGGQLECQGHTIYKRYFCASTQSYQVREFTFPFADGDGLWSFANWNVFGATDITFPSLPDFQFQFKCPPLHAVCGMGILKGKDPSDFDGSIKSSIEALFLDHICCPVRFNLCTESQIRVVVERVPSQCNVPVGANATCTVTISNERVQQVDNTAHTQTILKQVESFGADAGAKVGVGNVSVGLGLSYKRSSEKTKMYGFAESDISGSTDSVETTVTFATFRDRTLLTYQPYIYCGGFKTSSKRIIALLAPTVNCSARDEYIVFNVTEYKGSVESTISIPFTGHGLRWVTGRTPEQVDIPWKDIIGNFQNRIRGNPNLQFSRDTRIRWPFVDIKTFDEFNPERLTFPYKVKPGMRYIFSRATLFCGVDWILQPKVTESVERTLRVVEEPITTG